MAQVKIYARRAHLERVRDRLSDGIHHVLCDTLGLPADKRFHRFVGLDEDDIRHPADRSTAYTLVEIIMFAGRTDETKRACLEGLMASVPPAVDMAVEELEIVILEVPRANWGIRGQVGDRLELSYKVET